MPRAHSSSKGGQKHCFSKEHCFLNEGMLTKAPNDFHKESLDYKSLRKTLGKHVKAVSLIGLQTSSEALITVSIFKAGFYF